MLFAFIFSVLAVGRISVIDTPVVLTGTGSDSTSVSPVPTVELETGTPYVLRVSTSGGEKGGVSLLGLSGLTVHHAPHRHGNSGVYAFRTDPDAEKPRKNYRFSMRQWHIPGRFSIDRAELSKARVEHRRFGAVTLGYGERVDGNLYSFGTPDFKGVSRSLMRVPIEADRVGDDWQIGKNASLSLSFALPERQFGTARLSVYPSSFSRGSLFVEVSAGSDGKWIPVGVMTNKIHFTANVPRKILPAKELKLRLRGDSACQTTILKVGFDGEVSGPRMFAFGETAVFDEASGEKVLELKPWDYLSEVTGACVSDEDGLAVWRESSGRKVARGRPVPAATAPGLVVRTAANEAEAAQLVVTPHEDVSDVRVACTDFVGPHGRIGKAAARIRRVGYVMVDLDMDSMGARGRWPDPLFEQDSGGCAISANDNQSFWVTVKPPRGTAAGLYRGTLEVRWKAKGKEKSRSVPFGVEVFGFELPDRYTCETAFGCSPSRFLPYHRVRTSEEKKTVIEKYMEVLSEHHISPEDPAPLVRPKVSWKKGAGAPPETWEPEIDWKAWDDEVERVLAKWHFNTIDFSISGAVGSGKGAGRRDPQIAGISIRANPKAYDALVGKYLRAIEKHLDEKGWLDMAYVYWIDEPEAEDYPFVMQGNEILRRHAPRLRRMITDAPRPELEGGPNLWCPLTCAYDRERMAACRSRGDRAWWYITFSCEPPLLNEHVEHAGIDNRLWLWQTWQENISGILIWCVCHWNARDLYPDPLKPQNPYEDVMGWTHGWKAWTSGEGRYLYPPLRFFEGGADPVIEPPVDTIRLEMLREGIEDYEYFAMLRRRDPKNPLLKVPDEVSRSPREYSTDPAFLEAHRIRLARELAK